MYILDITSVSVEVPNKYSLSNTQVLGVLFTIKQKVTESKIYIYSRLKITHH